jgi:hypothetical protein
VTKALDEEVATAGAAVTDAAEGMDEAVKAKAQTELATAKEHVRLHIVQKTAIAAQRAASGRALGDSGRWVQGDSASQNQLRRIGSLLTTHSLSRARVWRAALPQAKRTLARKSKLRADSRQGTPNMGTRVSTRADIPPPPHTRTHTRTGSQF